jgi:hypothetical protein
VSECLELPLSSKKDPDGYFPRRGASPVEMDQTVGGAELCVTTPIVHAHPIDAVATTRSSREA